jgi:Cu/Ag efflux protein CusF
MLVRIVGITLSASLLLMQAASAQDRPAVEGAVAVEKGQGKVGATAVAVGHATITAVNRERREITVRRAGGDEVTVPVDERVRNFDQVQPGDEIVLRQAETIVLGLNKTDGKGIRERSVKEETARAPLGAKPGIAASRETHVVADVTAVDRKANTVTLRGVHHSRKLHVRDPQVLANIKKGDQVEAVLLEGEALSVEPARSK